MECINTLLIAGAAPNLQDIAGQHPLFPAALGGHAQCIEAVRNCMQTHTHTHTCTHTQHTHTHTCTHTQHICPLPISSKSSSTSSPPPLSFPPLLLSLSLPSSFLLPSPPPPPIQLLSYGCDPDLVDATGSTAVHQVVAYAARLHGTMEEGEWQMGVARNAQGIAALGEGGASLDMMDPVGNTPLHVRMHTLSTHVHIHICMWYV